MFTFSLYAETLDGRRYEAPAPMDGVLPTPDDHLFDHERDDRRPRDSARPGTFYDSGFNAHEIEQVFTDTLIWSGTLIAGGAIRTVNRLSAVEWEGQAPVRRWLFSLLEDGKVDIKITRV